MRPLNNRRCSPTSRTASRGRAPTPIAATWQPSSPRNSNSSRNSRSACASKAYSAIPKPQPCAPSCSSAFGTGAPRRTPHFPPSPRCPTTSPSSPIVRAPLSPGRNGLARPPPPPGVHFDHPHRPSDHWSHPGLLPLLMPAPSLRIRHFDTTLPLSCFVIHILADFADCQIQEAPTFPYKSLILF